MPVLNEIRQFQDEMVAWRRDLHANPELGFAETRTSAFIQERLKSFRGRRDPWFYRNRRNGGDSWP